MLSAALGADIELGQRPLAIIALAYFAIHLIAASMLLVKQKKRLEKAAQNANTLISLLLFAVPLLRFFFRILTRQKKSAV